MYFMIATNICTCSVWSLNAEPWTRSVWKDEMYVIMERSFIVLDMKLREIQNWLRRTKFAREIKKEKWKINAEIFTFM